MNPTKAFQLFLFEALTVGSVAGYLLSVVQPAVIPPMIRYRPYTYSMAASFILQLLYRYVIRPIFLDPLRDLPTARGVSTLGLLLWTHRCLACF